MTIAMLNWAIMQGRMTSHIFDLNLDIGRKAGSCCRMTHTFAGTLAKRREVAGKILPAVVCRLYLQNFVTTCVIQHTLSSVLKLPVSTDKSSSLDKLA